MASLGEKIGMRRELEGRGLEEEEEEGVGLEPSLLPWLHLAVRWGGKRPVASLPQQVREAQQHPVCPCGSRSWSHFCPTVSLVFLVVVLLCRRDMLADRQKGEKKLHNETHVS